MKSKGMQILTQAEFDALEASDLLVDGRQYYIIDGVPRGLVSRAYFDAEMANKVDKEDGKVLSENDLTDELKENYDTAYSHSQETGNPHGTDADDIDDSSTINKFVTASDKENWNNKVEKTTNILIGDGNGNAVDSGISAQVLQNEIDGKQDALTFDDIPTIGSNNPVKSGGIYTAIENKTLGDVADNSIPLSKLKSVSVNVSLSPQFFDFVDKDWSGMTDFNGQDIWTDGTNIYYSRDSTQKVLNIATSTWSDNTWSGQILFRGSNIWTDGNNIYYSYGAAQKVLDVATSTWNDKTWNGVTNSNGMIDFNGSYVWTDGNNIYYSAGSRQKVLNVATSTWSDKTWNGLNDFYSSYIWTDGNNIYHSIGSIQKVLNVATSTWSDKTWSGVTNLDGSYIWTDGTNIYYSNGTIQKVLNVATSTWSNKTWSGLTEFSMIFRYIWTDGNNIYYSRGSTQKVLITNKKIHR